MAGLTTSAGAVDVYSTTHEAEPLLKSSALMSTYDSGISLAAVEPSDLDAYLKYGSYSVAQYLASIKYFLSGSSSPSFTGSSFLTLLRDVYEDYFYGNGYYLASTGNSSSAGGNNSIAEYLRNGFLGLSTNIKAVTSAIQSLDFNDYSSILSSIYSSVDGLESGLTSANTAIGGVTTAVNNVRTAVNNVVSGLTTVNTSVGTVNTSVNTVGNSIVDIIRRSSIIPAGTTILNGNGQLLTLANDSYQWNMIRLGFNAINTVGNSIVDIIRRSSVIPAGTTILNGNGQLLTLANDDYQWNMIRLGFNAMNSHLLTTSGASYLSSSGTQGTLSSDTLYNNIIRSALLGLSANIKGSEADNIYASTLNDNNNTVTTVNSTGLGPLLNTQLSNIGENLGHLAYVFASDDEIKLKQDSEPIMEEVGSIYDDSDSKVKVNADGIGGVKNVVGEFGDFLEVDAGIDDVITIVTNPQSYAWLTQDTLNNLDTVGVSTFTRGQSWHDRLYSEFYEEYFPERID